MKSTNSNLRTSTALVLATSVCFCAGVVHAASGSGRSSAAKAEPQATAKTEPQTAAKTEPQTAAPAEPLAQPQPLPPPMPYGYQPYANWRPLEVATPVEKKSETNFVWDPLRFAVAAEVRTLWPQNSATRRLVGKDAPDSGGITLGCAVLNMNKASVVLDLGWNSMASTNANSWSAEEEKLRTQLVSLGLSVRYSVLRWLAPYARVAGGLGWDKITIGEGSGEWQDRHLFTQGSAGGGLYLRSPGLRMASAFSIALMGSIEGGYFLAPNSNVALKPWSDPQIKNPIPAHSVPIGDMGRSAPYLRMTLGLAF